eukprot:5759308-Prymnesium_polylepis.1
MAMSAKPPSTSSGVWCRLPERLLAASCPRHARRVYPFNRLVKRWLGAAPVVFSTMVQGSSAFQSKSRGAQLRAE